MAGCSIHYQNRTQNHNLEVLVYTQYTKMQNTHYDWS